MSHDQTESLAVEAGSTEDLQKQPSPASKTLASQVSEVKDNVATEVSENDKKNTSTVPLPSVFITPRKPESVKSESGSVNSENDLERDSSSNNNDSSKSKKRRKVFSACVYCRRSHMNCDESRPCKRCVKRNIGHLCHDKPLKNNKPMISNIIEMKKNLDDIQSTTQLTQQELPKSTSSIFFNSLPSATALNQQPFFYSEHAGSEFNSLTEFLSMIDDNDMLDTINLTNDPLLQKLEAANYISSMSSNSNIANINPNMKQPSLDITNSQVQQLQSSQIQQPAMLSYIQPGIDMLQQHHQQLQQQQQQHQQQQQQQQPIQFQTENSQFHSHTKQDNFDPSKSSYQQTPHISDAARDKFFLTAADPTTEISPEERLKQVINAKLEAGLLKPYDYAKGYQRLQTYMDKYMAPSSRARILKPLSTFRPGFRAIAKTLKDIDLILVEESFERMLLDYDRVFTSMAIPACLWRRTGEIYRGNKEFASLVNVSIEDLKNGKLTIYELMTEESSVNFWEKYGSIAFDKTQKAVLTSCNLRTRDGRKKKNCCFSFTIRRDRYNIPSCIVGNFIPIR
ncbi:hypothetical protein CANINC_004546 [Pichia inconspicua]|uniref:Zn(2)-C6 fungal-type domain-containing protein n=1 Tax=Pichia inconspicua TaxID=52247 RepID=A0A4T0WVQ2_9ASCO|nr:hypothetical protein CANINC_004546 [[Candida] inconspicua]